MGIELADIDSALRGEDIEGLLAVGAPGDEYSHVADIILEVFSEMSIEDLTEERMVAVISQIWIRNFNLSAEDIKLRLPAFQRVAHHVLSNVR